MKLGKKIAAVATALALGLGGAVAVAAPASAHTGGVTGVASCEADGTYTIEWTYNANYVPNGVEAETKAMTTSSGSLATIDGVNKGGQIFLSVWSDHQVNVPGAPVKTGNWSAKFKTVGIPGSFVGDVTTMVQTDWKNGPSEDPVGKVKLDGKCTPPAIKDAAASILTTPATCEANGTATWDTLLNATGSELVQTPGAQTGVATATTNHQFSDGSTVQNLPYTVEAKLDPTKPPCFTPPKPEAQSEERVLTEVNCDTKSAQDTYQERHTVEPTFDPATNTWSEPVWTEWDTVGVEERAATTEECPAVVVPPVVTPSPTPSATPSDTPAPTSDVSKLAETGQSTNMAPVFWFIAVVVGLGAAFLIGSLLWRREHPVNTEV